MPRDAAVVNSWQDPVNAYLAVAVTEDNGDRIEYIGSVPVEDLRGLSASARKARLVAAVKVVRDAQQTAPSGLGITGTVQV